LLSGGPRIIAATPTTPVNLRAATLESMTVTFDRPIDYVFGGGTFTVDDVAIAGPQGVIAPTGIISLGGNQYQVTFATQTERGSYSFPSAPTLPICQAT